LHYWETIMQGQIIFQKLLDEIKKMHENNQDNVSTNIGSIERIKLHDHQFQQKVNVNDHFSYKPNKNLIFYQIAPVPSAFGVHKSFVYFLNGKDFQGFGFIVVHDKFNGTKAIFRGSGIPDVIWKKLTDKIKLLEPESWYDASSELSKSFFLLNGNRTHQYVPQSDIGITELAKIVSTLK